jgi:transcriptional regulator with XRE-family HTH domain
MMTTTARPVGDLLREWRQRRRMSQLDLACEAEVSTRHLSFVETGRAAPSRDMVLHLAERLSVPLRDRNLLLTAAGFAPIFPERKLDDPALLAARASIDAVLQGHEPNPALAVDRHWVLVAGNAAMQRLVAGVDPTLLRPPVNVMRLSLHPGGLAPRIANLAQWREHVITRLRRQFEVSGDTVLSDLLEEIRDYPAPPPSRTGQAQSEYDGVAVPFRLVTIEGTLTFFSTVTVFGTPVDITLSELAIESFFPADAGTAEIMRRMAASPARPSAEALPAAAG